MYKLVGALYKSDRETTNVETSDVINLAENPCYPLGNIDRLGGMRRFCGRERVKGRKTAGVIA